MGEYLKHVTENKITEIMNGQKCPLDFKCLKRGLENIKFNRPFAGWHIFKCQCEEPQECPYSSPFGYCHICKCPLLNHINIVRELEADLETINYEQTH